MSRRGLQAMTTLVAVVPIATGAFGLLGLRDPLYVRFGVVPNAVLDSNLRFFSGFWLGTGLAVLWLVPRIEKEASLFRALWGMIFLGGLGRLVSIAGAGAPPWPFYVIMALELLGAPVFVLWQLRVAREALVRAPAPWMGAPGRGVDLPTAPPTPIPTGEAKGVSCPRTDAVGGGES